MFTEEHFLALSQTVKCDLRDLLREKEVYVTKGRNFQIADALQQAVDDFLPCPKNKSGEGTLSIREFPRRDVIVKTRDETVSFQTKLPTLDLKSVPNVSNLMKTYHRDKSY